MAGLASLRQLKNATRVLPNQQSVKVENTPPPVGGWNQRDTLPLMEPRDAIILDNWIPDTNSVHLRGGYDLHATIAATATAVESLIQYTPPTVANKQLFAAIPTAIYDVTAIATASSTAAVVTSLTNGRWYHDQMSNSAGHYLMLANGADAPRLYDGTTWTTVSCTTVGLTNTSIIGFHNHQNRMWLWEESKLYAWYLDTSAIAGAATQFFPSFNKGGKLMAMGSWTRDGGAGSDDFAVFISSRGECSIYSGFSPGSANSWELVGVYSIPEVIGRRCFVNAGADLAILTVQGLVPLSQILGLSPAAAARTTITDKISGYFRAQYYAFGAVFGWEVCEYPRQNLLIINLPITERSLQYQVVMNVYTGAWARWTGLNAGCWARLGDDLYFGSNDCKVYRYGVSTTDNGSNIVGTLQTSYSDYGTPATKRFVMARPAFLAPSAYNPPVTIQLDYDVTAPAVTVIAAGTSGTQWDAGQWNTFQWAGGQITSAVWQGTTGEGAAASIAIAVASKEPITFNGADIAFETGNYL